MSDTFKPLVKQVSDLRESLKEQALAEIRVMLKPHFENNPDDTVSLEVYEDGSFEFTTEEGDWSDSRKLDNLFEDTKVGIILPEGKYSFVSNVEKADLVNRIDELEKKSQAITAELKKLKEQVKKQK